MENFWPAVYACGQQGAGARPRVPRILLVELADEHARPAFTSVDIDIPLTQQVLASLIASSRVGS
jgi:hypothetical protein